MHESHTQYMKVGMTDNQIATSWTWPE